MRALFDTNVLIDYLHGVEAAKVELARFEDCAISTITWIEVMVGVRPEDDRTVRAFLRRFSLIPLRETMAEIAVRIRKERRIKLPDAIIAASAASEDRLLVTRNTRDFDRDDPAVRIPYEL
ncbi:MAG: type II toxin-antitoxin system VapC family toxin [Spirochaetales bacterium]|nr:type II toxin-antitoxin system VapC family toxin [Spirochaetales bacterium]